MFSGNAFNHSLQKVLFARLLSKNLNSNLSVQGYNCAILYGRETCSLTPTDEYCSKVFENRTLRRIFGPKREEVAGDWRRLRKEDLHNLCASSNIRVIISRNMGWGACGTHGGDEKCIQNFGWERRW